MSLAGQWDAVIDDVLRCRRFRHGCTMTTSLNVTLSYSILDLKPVEILMTKLAEPTIKLACVAGVATLGTLCSLSVRALIPPASTGLQ